MMHEPKPIHSRGPIKIQTKDIFQVEKKWYIGKLGGWECALIAECIL